MKMYDNEFDRIIEAVIKPNLRTIYDMKIRGLKDRHIAKKLGISLKLFMRAVDEFQELKELYQDATTLLCSKLRNVVVERALGEDNKTDKDGKLLGPDHNLAFKMLEKLDPEFSKRETTNVTITVEDVIRQIGNNRKEEDEDEEGFLS